MTEQTGGLVAPEPTPSSALAVVLREVPGVAMLLPPRAQGRDVLARAASALVPSRLATGPLGGVSGGSAAEPVLARVSADEIVVAVDVGVAAGASAPAVARAVGGAAREWCLREHPDRTARVTVRIAAVD